MLKNLKGGSLEFNSYIIIFFGISVFIAGYLYMYINKKKEITKNNIQKHTNTKNNYRAPTNNVAS